MTRLFDWTMARCDDLKHLTSRCVCRGPSLSGRFHKCRYEDHPGTPEQKHLNCETPDKQLPDYYYFKKSHFIAFRFSIFINKEPSWPKFIHGHRDVEGLVLMPTYCISPNSFSEHYCSFDLILTNEHR